MNPENTRSVDELTSLANSGLRPKYLFFWGHIPKVPGQIDQSCLSNWFPAEFTVDGTRYSTTEQFMMAEKARLFTDESIRSQILQTENPGAAKRLGRKVSGFDEATWCDHRFEIVVAGNDAKFSQNAGMGDFLRRTGAKVHVEASPLDRIWGIGIGKDHEHVENPTLWKGQNLLGFALMEVRERLSERPENHRSATNT